MAATLAAVETLPDIFYEDPEPVEDGMQQAIPLSRIVYLLHEYYAERDDVYVGGGGFLMYDRYDGNERVAPDCYIAFDVDAAGIEKMANFWVWRVGKVPDFALEMASESTAANDMGHKRDLYAELEIPEYWRLDRTGGEMYGRPITGERLVGGEYEPYPLRAGRVDGSVVCDSELLGLRFYWDAGKGFDILDPVTDLSIDRVAAAEGRAVRDRDARLEAEGRALAAEGRAVRDRDARLAAEGRALEAEGRAVRDRDARLAAEREVRLLREELERLRGR